MSTRSDTVYAKYGVRPHQSGTAYKALREAIIAGRIPQGTQLNERSLSERFGFSRTPIRHALVKLAAEGLVEQIPHVGTFVRKLTTDEALELVTFRRAIESACAAMAAINASPQQLAELRKLGDEIAESDETLEGTLGREDTLEVAAANREKEITFHRRVAELSSNAEMMRTFGNASTVYLTLFPGSMGRNHMSVPCGAMGADHAEVARAIATGDPKQAFGAMWTHFNALLHVLNAEMAKQNGDTPLQPDGLPARSGGENSESL